MVASSFTRSDLRELTWRNQLEDYYDLSYTIVSLIFLTPFAGYWLAAFTMPTLVLIGDQDEDNGSARDLAEALPEATYVEVPGTHMSCVTRPEFGEAIARFGTGMKAMREISRTLT